MLDGVRVLEISAPETMLAGRILADLGAEVVTVEPPGGAAGRRLEPFLDGIPGLERSLTWHALNRNKRGITLDLASADGRALLGSIARNFAAAVELAGPGGAAPLDPIDLPPTILRCTIGAFARSGPKSAYLASDLLVMAAGGAAAMTGDPDRAPLFHPVPQSMMEAGAEAAIAMLGGLIARVRDGAGQRTGVSARIAAMMTALSTPLFAAAGNPPPRRAQAAIAGVRVPAIYECADGYMLVTVAAFGPAFGPMTQRLAEWAADDGHLAPEIAQINWITFPQDLARGAASAGQLKALVDGVAAACRSKSKSALGAAARKHGLLAAPLMDMKDIAESPQYHERGLFTKVRVRPAGGEIEAPARFAQFSNFTIGSARPAPALSEHTAEVLRKEAGISETELQALFVHGVI